MPVDSLLLDNSVICVALALLATAVPFVRRKSILAIVGAVALAAAFRDRVPGVLIAVTFVYLGTLLIGAVASRSSHAATVRWRGAVHLNVVLILGFTALRLTGPDSILESNVPELTVGNFVVLALEMWLVLRLVTYVWEIGAGKIERPSPVDFVAWVFNPFTLFGPVLRMSEFGSWPVPVAVDAAATRSRGRIPARHLLLGFAQMSGGYVLAYAHNAVNSTPSLPRPVQFALGVFVFAPWSAIMALGGYMKVMEACAATWGINLPPSFDRPFAQRNISDFWARWNMTATRVFRDYAFYARWGLSRPNIYLNTMVVFILVGLWHGAIEYWLTWGTLHGIGFCGFLAYRRFGSTLRGRCTWFPAPIKSGLGIATTYVFVCVCWSVPPWLIRQGYAIFGMFFE